MMQWQELETQITISYFSGIKLQTFSTAKNTCKYGISHGYYRKLLYNLETFDIQTYTVFFKYAPGTFSFPSVRKNLTITFECSVLGV